MYANYLAVPLGVNTNRGVDNVSDTSKRLRQALYRFRNDVEMNLETKREDADVSSENIAQQICKRGYQWQ
jgi:uncharacterized Fe-S cluster-containing MiaB family protein